jgi:hypothetical protein
VSTREAQLEAKAHARVSLLVREAAAEQIRCPGRHHEKDKLSSSSRAGLWRQLLSPTQQLNGARGQN